MASRVLRDVTNYKGARLVEQQAWFEERKRSLLEKAENSEDPVATLLEGLGELGFKTTIEPVCFSNIRLMHKQSQHDASVPAALIRQWRDDLQRLLEIKSTKYEYAALFSKLATEWVDKPNDANLLLGSSSGSSNTSSQGTIPVQESSAATESSELLSGTDILPEDDSPEPVQVGREEMYRQRQQWDSFVFSERHTDKKAIKNYLTDLFVEESGKKRVTESPFDHLRKSIGEFGLNSDMDINLTCTTEQVRICINAVLKADLFTGHKRDELIDLKDARPAVLKEVADVINLGLGNLDIWQWKPSPIPANMRRQLNGKYRVYMDPEVHQALLVQWVGTNFAAALKRIIKSFYRTNAWPKSTYNSMTNHDRTRASFYVPEDQSKKFYKSVLHVRREQFKDDFLMTQLPSTIHEGSRDYDGNEDSDEDEDGNEIVGKSPLNVKQTLLRVATTELILQKKIYGSFNLCTTDFKWFGPSLPHDTIFSVLEFLGVHEKWLSFFRKFLSMPLVFPHDGPNAEVRTRTCGVPISQTLSDAFGEAVLFCLDFAVSKASKGSCQLYRFHDDVWFWGQQNDCEVAWQTINSFIKVMGLELNQEKTGSVQIGVHEQSRVLPKGPVRWGFLKLDADQGRWLVDMKQVDEHIVEIRRQLAQCRSVFSWIQAWNSYITSFLRNNFGHAANCLGSDHLDMVFVTFKYIQQKLFDMGGMTSKDRASEDKIEEGASEKIAKGRASVETAGNRTSKETTKDVTSYVKATIESRFGVTNVANAFLYWPTELGGLDVRNPFIPLLTVRNKSMDVPAERIDRAFEEEEELYEAARTTFEQGKRRRGGDVPSSCDPEVFFSYEEYVSFPEETSEALKRAYEELLESPRVNGVAQTRACSVALQSLPRENSKNIRAKWTDMDTYWHWILQLYAEEAMERFGGLILGEKEYLPVELVNLMKTERMRWQG